MNRFWLRLRNAMIATYRDGGFGLAKGAAYSALLSFFPVLTTTATLLAQFRAEAVSRVLARFLLGVVPPGTEDLVRDRFTEQGARPMFLLVIAGLLSVWAASGAITSLLEGFHRAYRVTETRPWLKERAVAILLVFAAAAPAVGASGLILFGARTENALMRWVGFTWAGQELRGGLALIGVLLRMGIALSAVVLVTGLMYHFGPARPIRWRSVLPGAALATVLWLAVTLAFTWYVRNIANYNLFYGSIGAAIALLVWMYLLAIIALLGCEFNAAPDR